MTVPLAPILPRRPRRPAGHTFLIALGLACVLAVGCATPDAPWPAKVVDPDGLQVVGRLGVTRPMRNLSDPVAGGTTVLRLHIDAQGRVRAHVIPGAKVHDAAQHARNARQVRDAHTDSD